MRRSAGEKATVNSRLRLTGSGRPHSRTAVTACADYYYSYAPVETHAHAGAGTQGRTCERRGFAMDSTAARLVIAGGLAAGGIALCMSPTSTSKASGLTLAALKDPSLVKLLAEQGLDPVRRSCCSSCRVLRRLTPGGCA